MIGSSSAPLLIVGLGPARLDRLPVEALDVLRDDARTVIVRTLLHPAAYDLSQIRSTVSCDDLYRHAEYDQIYDAITDRVMAAAASGPTVYAVPGSALVGERAATEIRRRCEAAGVEVGTIPGESFLDLALNAVGVDPIADGFQLLDARSVPDPMPLHLPTMFTQVDTAGVVAELADRLGQVLAYDTMVVVLDHLGSEDEAVTALALEDLCSVDVGPLTSVYVPPQKVGWIGLVEVNRLLREQCPWDREQTHRSLARHVVEEAYETVDAISHLSAEAPNDPPDFGAYAAVEEELGDLLLQVVFHATLAREAGVFDLDQVAEGIRRKLVARHRHVFGDVELATSSEVEANWERNKSREKGRASLMDDIPNSMAAVVIADKMQRRAASVGFDWLQPGQVYGKLVEEVGELGQALDTPAAVSELGDVLFTVVNLARHLDVDAEVALRQAAEGFSIRFRHMENANEGDLGDLSACDLADLWQDAKLATGRRLD